MIVGQTPEGLYIIDRNAATNFDEASDQDQTKYFLTAYDVLEANPELLKMYEREPQTRLGEELWDIDHKNPKSRYNTLRDFINKNKFNIPVDRYSGKPITKDLAKVLELINNKDDKEATQNVVAGLQGVI